MPVSQPKPGGEDELNSVQQWELLQCWNTASQPCLVPWVLLPVGSLCVSGCSPGNKATVPSETLNCSILWLRVCPELTFTWEHNQNLFRSFSSAGMQIKMFLLLRGKSLLHGELRRVYLKPVLGGHKTVMVELEAIRHLKAQSITKVDSIYSICMYNPQQVVFPTIKKL